MSGRIGPTCSSARRKLAGPQEDRDSLGPCAGIVIEYVSGKPADEGIVVYTGSDWGSRRTIRHATSGGAPLGAMPSNSGVRGRVAPPYFQGKASMPFCRLAAKALALESCCTISRAGTHQGAGATKQVDMRAMLIR